MLIAYICMAEACMSFNAMVEVVNPVIWLCYWQIEKMFAWTVSINSMQCAANVLCSTNGLFF